jgi:carbamoyltransferase
VAPVVALDGLHLIVDERDVGPSPYMSFSHSLTPTAQQLFPAITHYDGTSRIQTVTDEQESWLYALLKAIQNKTGYPILMNTSFNTKGRPLVNKVSY